MAENRTLDLALRALQLLFAIVVIGTDSYAISIFVGHNDVAQTPAGSFPTWHGVPGSWGFLLFFAVWTVLLVIFSLAVGTGLGYVRMAGELIAVLSWFAGFIAVAVQLGTDTSIAKLQNPRAFDLLKAACALGALEWLLFVVTTVFTFKGGLGAHRTRAAPAV